MEKPTFWETGLGRAAQWFLSAVVGGVVVAFLHQFFAVQLEQHKTLLQIRKDAYSDFFEGQTALKLLPAADINTDDYKKLEAQYRSKVINSRFMIGVYGSKPTVEAMWKYFDGSFPVGDCNGPNPRDDIQIYQRMREELYSNGLIQRIVLGNQLVDDEKAALVIQNCRLPPKPDISVKPDH